MEDIDLEICQCSNKHAVKCKIINIDIPLG